MSDEQTHDQAAPTLATRVDRVVAACLQEASPPDEAIMFRFRSMDQFRRFIEKILVIGSAGSSAR